MVAGGIWFYRDKAKRFRQRAESEPLAVAKLKVNEIVRWRDDRMAMASEIMQRLFTVEEVIQLIRGTK